MRHAGARALLEYWRALRAGRSAPDRSQVSAEGLGPTLARDAFILERPAGGPLRFRLAGGRLYDLFGMELRGAPGATIFREESRAAFAALAAACLDETDLGVMRAVASHGEDRLQVEIPLAPLTGEDGRVDRLIGCVGMLDPAPEAIAPAPRRLRIRDTQRLSAPSAPAATGMAEEQAPFEGPGLRAIDGGGEAPGEKRRGHLKLVKD